MSPVSTDARKLFAEFTFDDAFGAERGASHDHSGVFVGHDTDDACARVMFRAADVVLINKVDLAPHLDTDATTYVGAWLSWLREVAAPVMPAR